MKLVDNGWKQHMNEKISKTEKKQIIKNVIAGLILIVFFFALHNLDSIGSFIKTFFSIIAPIIWGYGLAFLLRPLQYIIESNLKFKKQSTNRFIATFISLIIFVIAFVLILLFILPDLIVTIISLSEQFPQLVQSLQSFYEGLDLSEEIRLFVQDSLTQIQQYLINTAQNSISTLITGALDFTNILVDSFMALAFSVYFSINREYIWRNFKKLSLAIFNDKTADRLVKMSHISSNVFKQFLYSKGASSLLLGIVSFVVLSLFNIKYALLISTIFGVFNLLPMFGIIFSLIITVVFLMLVQIDKVIIVTISLIILKAIENFFVTKTLFGDPVNLPSLWILIALIIGGYIYGPMGLFISVPIFTILYTTIKAWVDKKSHLDEVSDD